MNVVNRVQTTRSTLQRWWQIGKSSSEVNRQIAVYLEQHYREAAFMTSAELAAAVGVSQASISRFAGLLGFNGYGSWIKELHELIRLELSAGQRMWFADHPTLEDGDNVRDRVLAGEHENLRQLADIVESDAFSCLASRLTEAGRVVLVSARASATLIPYAHYFLSKIRPNVHMAVWGDTLWERLPTEDPAGTLVVAVAFPRYPRVLIEFVRLLADHGFSVAALTDHPESPVAVHADPVVNVPVTSASVFDSYATPMALLNLLIRRIAQLSPDRTRERLNRIESLDRLNGVYY
ncbi:MAG: MurR/RpiR family transcriptional regulator [Alicyclobacillus sp.]|nr:MurR/RpiR family transcriptional regulator [Alicyclobacillus sp.]